jgi:hypothetical protein
MARCQQQTLHNCQKGQSNRDGNLTSGISIPPAIRRFDCTGLDWNKYLTQVWDNVIQNKDPKAWIEDLEQAGSGQADLPDPQMCDLENQVHPIFARLNWVQGTSEDLWKVLLPSLRLASRMVLSEPACAFFQRV